MRRIFLERDVGRILAACSAVAKAVVLTTPDGDVAWSSGPAALATHHIAVATPGGDGRLSVDPAAAAAARVAAAALEHSVGARAALDDLAATTRRLWWEENLFFSAGEILRYGRSEEEMAGWLIRELAVVSPSSIALTAWDGHWLTVIASDPPSTGVGIHLVPSPLEAELLDGGEPRSSMWGDGTGSAAISCGIPVATGQPYVLSPLRCADRIQGLVLLLRPPAGAPFTAQEIKIVQLLSDIASVAFANRGLVREAEHTARLVRELELAAEIQQRLLPSARARYGSIDVAAVCTPVTWVGGDGYMHRRLPGGEVMAAILDVTGHGVPASLALSALTARFDTLVEVVTSPGALLGLLNDQMVRFDPRSNTLATAVVAFLAPGDGSFRISSAGHPPPFILRGDGSVGTPGEGGLPLGVLPGTDYPTVEGALAPGESIVLYSDGASDAAGRGGARLGWEGLGAGLRRIRAASAEAVVSAVMRLVADFSAGIPPADDLTVVAVHRAGADHE